MPQFYYPPAGGAETHFNLSVVDVLSNKSDRWKKIDREMEREKKEGVREIEGERGERDKGRKRGEREGERRERGKARKRFD